MRNSSKRHHVPVGAQDLRPNLETARVGQDDNRVARAGPFERRRVVDLRVRNILGNQPSRSCH